MSCRSAMSRPYVVWRRVDGSPDIVAALLHNDSESPCTVAWPLCVTSWSAPYCHCLDVSIYFTHLMRCLLRVPRDVMMSLMSGVSRNLWSHLGGNWAQPSK
jgi:hypothetical protein